MDRRYLTDGTGRWFSVDKADFLGHINQEDGGTQHEENLYYTAKGMFVIEKETYGQAQDNQRECTEVTPEEAVAFLTDNGIDVPEWLEHLSGDEV